MPSAAQAGDMIGSFSAAGYYSGKPNSYFVNGDSRASVAFYASEGQTNTSNGTYVSIATTQNGTTAQLERMRIDNSGNVGIGTTDPKAALDVAGQIRPSMGTPLVNPTGNKIDFKTGNTQYATFTSCPSNALTVNLYSMLEGGSYTMVLITPNACVVSFTATNVAIGEAGGTAVTAFKYPGGQKFSATANPVVYTFVRANDTAFVAQVVDFQ